MQGANPGTVHGSGRMARRRLIGGALGVGGLAALLGAACGKSTTSSGGSSQAANATAGATTSAAAAEPKRGGKIVFTDGRDPEQFDPVLASYLSQYILSSTHSRLLGWKHGADVHQLDYVATPEDGVAAKWEQPDATTYVFSLKQNVKFHNRAPLNGRTLNAEDVQFTFRRIKESGRENDISPILDSVTAIDPSTVQFKFKQPYAPFLNLVGHTRFVIVAPELGEYGKAEQVVGTGPFMMDKYQPGVETSMVRNPDYFKAGLPYLDSFIYRVRPDVNAIYAGTRTGDIDLPFFFWNGIPPSITDELLTSNKKLAKRQWDLTSPRFVTARMDRPPFNDVRVRRAVSLAIDRNQWINLVHEGKGRPSGAMPYMLKAPLYIEHKDLGDAGKYLRTDVAEAKKLMEAAGYGSGFDTEYKPYTALTAKLPEVDLVSSQLERINIRAKPVYLDGPLFQQRVTREKNYDGMLFWTHGFTSDFDPLMYATYITVNAMMINDPQLTNLMNQQRSAVNNDERQKIVHEFQKYQADQCYALYEPIADQFMVHPKSVQNFGPHNSFDAGGMAAVIWRDDV